MKLIIMTNTFYNPVAIVIDLGIVNIKSGSIIAAVGQVQSK